MHQENKQHNESQPLWKVPVQKPFNLVFLTKILIPSLIVGAIFQDVFFVEFIENFILIYNNHCS